MAQQRRRRIHAQRQHLAFDRPHRRFRRLRQTGDLARPRARREHDDIGIDAPVVERDAGHTAGRALDRRDLGVLMQLAAGGDESHAQRPHQLAVLDLMIAGAIDRGGEIGMKMGSR